MAACSCGAHVGWRFERIGGAADHAHGHTHAHEHGQEHGQEQEPGGASDPAVPGLSHESFFGLTLGALQLQVASVWASRVSRPASHEEEQQQQQAAIATLAEFVNLNDSRASVVLL